jgi:hypothetical protein
MGYCDRGDIEDIFGIENVKVWADLDNDHDVVKIAARIVVAIDKATEWIDDHLRDSIYTIPLVAEDGGNLPATVIDMCATRAGVWLYEARGVQDFDSETGTPLHRLGWHRKNADRTMLKILSEQITIACVSVGVTTPAAEETEETET